VNTLMDALKEPDDKENDDNEEKILN